MAKTPQKELKARDPFEGVPYGVHALIRNEGVTVEEIRLEDIALQDETWRLRDAPHQAMLVENMAHCGQLTPVVLRMHEEPGRWQILSGFRRIAALRQLKRTTVAARLFDQIVDIDCVKLVISENLFGGDLRPSHIDALIDRLRPQQVLTPELITFCDWARERAAQLAPEPIDMRQASGAHDLNGLIEDTFQSLSAAGQGLEQIFVQWSDVKVPERRMLAAECKYIHDLYPFLTR